jgi:DNA-binding NarL/FixJ family response regulator
MTTGKAGKGIEPGADDACATFVVGPNRFQNQVLAAYLDNHRKGASRVATSVAECLASRTSNFADCVLILYDCFSLSGSKLEAAVFAELAQLPEHWALLLFNLERCCDFEKTALEYGVRGFLYQDDTVETVLRGVVAVAAGELWVTRQKMAEVIASGRKQSLPIPYLKDLTRRELDILDLLVAGANNKMIGEKLFISHNTVRTHIHNIFGKIGVSTRLEASVWAAETLFGRSQHLSSGMRSSHP